MATSREQAWSLLTQYNKEPFHLRHAITVEHVMGWFAQEEGFGAEKDFWSVVGLLHDLDFEQWPEEHCEKSQELMRQAGVEESIIRATASHGWGLRVEIKPEHQMEKILFATDELTGLIGAAALMRPSKSVADMELKSLKKKFKDKKFAAGCSRDVITQGAELLGCDPARLDEAAAEGVAAINLTWNHANALSGSSKEEPERGLSPLGREFVAKMEDLHILVDVSHLSEAGFWDVAELARRPFIASHSNAKLVWDHTRSLTDGQINAIIKNQGVIGLNFYEEFVGGSRDLDMVRAHLDHLLELGGEKTVALGGDWDGCDTIADLPAIDSLPRLYEHLLHHGYRETVVQDLFYNNLMRVVR